MDWFVIFFSIRIYCFFFSFVATLLPSQACDCALFVCVFVSVFCMSMSVSHTLSVIKGI